MIPLRMGASDLRRRLAAYPTYAAPFPGALRGLPRERMRRNLADLLARKAERVTALGALLANLGLEVPADPAAPPPRRIPSTD